MNGDIKNKEVTCEIPDQFKEIVFQIKQARLKLGLSRQQFYYLVKVSSVLLSRRDFLKEVTSQLAKLRYVRGLTQEVVNERIGVADRLVNKWECGDKNPSGFNLMCWCEVLNCKLMAVPDELSNNIRKQIADYYEQEQKKR